MDRSPEARRLYDAAAVAQAAADYLALARLAREIIALGERDADTLALAWGEYFLGASHFQRSDAMPAERSYRKAEELFAKIDNREGITRAMLGRAAVSLDLNLDADAARQIYDVAVPIIRQIGDPLRLGIVLGNLGEIHRLEGDSARALQRAREAVDLFQKIGNSTYAGWQLTSMGHYHLLRREYAASLESMRAAHRELLADPLPLWVAWYFDIWFIIAATLNRWDVAARLLGFVNRYRDEHSVPRRAGILPWFSTPVERLSEHFDQDTLHELFTEGDSLTVERAQALVEDIEPISG